MAIQNKDLKRRIISLSYKHKLSHLGSCLTAVDIIDEIYSIKKPDEKFVLSSGHAGLALYCVIEKYTQSFAVSGKLAGVAQWQNGINAETIFNHHGVHPDRCSDCGLDCSTGSLGQGLPIAVGMALADRSKNVYCLISDGECSEGSIWEALRIAWDNPITNLKIYININGWGAYQKIERSKLEDRLFEFNKLVQSRYTNFEDFPFLGGQEAHYITLNEENYLQAMEILK